MEKDKEVTVEKAIEVLNRAVKSDPDAMDKLFNHRVPCNEILAEDPTIQVRGHRTKGWSIDDTKGIVIKEESNYKVGLLGILNGIFGVDEESWGFISMIEDLACPNGCENPLEIESNKNIKPNCIKCGRQLIHKLTKFERTLSAEERAKQ